MHYRHQRSGIVSRLVNRPAVGRMSACDCRAVADTEGEL